MKKKLSIYESVQEIKHREQKELAEKLHEKASNKCSEIISDRANMYDKAGYLAVIQKELESSWEAGIVKLTKKCQDFSVDESNVTACNPEMTSKGFEVVIKDGKPRLIYARVIWAAEYSLIVEPHIRYIVTERRV